MVISDSGRVNLASSCARVRIYELVPVVAGVLATPKLGEGGSLAKFALLQPERFQGCL
jgi:hypothetical protein